MEASEVSGAVVARKSGKYRFQAVFAYGILTPAYRTPPVRGQDRVHLHDIPIQGSHEPPFCPLLRTPGMT